MNQTNPKMLRTWRHCNYRTSMPTALQTDSNSLPLCVSGFHPGSQSRVVSACPLFPSRVSLGQSSFLPSRNRKSKTSCKQRSNLTRLTYHRDFSACCVQNRLRLDFQFQLQHVKSLDIITLILTTRTSGEKNPWTRQKTEVTEQRATLKSGDTGEDKDHS